MMSDFIEREAALAAVMDWCPDDDGSVAKTGDIRDLLDEIESIPAADVRPVVRGKWIDTDNYYQRWKCSVCGNHTRDARPPFCPNCGAVMREES